ncbi:unnamed protein product [Musa acuminata subsp. burmannicoides]
MRPDRRRSCCRCGGRRGEGDGEGEAAPCCRPPGAVLRRGAPGVASGVPRTRVLGHGVAAFPDGSIRRALLVLFLRPMATIISAHGCRLFSKRRVKQDEDYNRFPKGGVEQNNSVALPIRTNNNMNSKKQMEK